MKLKTIAIQDKSGVALAKISVKHQQNKNKGVYNNSANTPIRILRGKRSYNFKKEYERYIDDNYGDVVSRRDKKKLMGLVEEHYNEGCIENVVDLHKHIEIIGKREGILFD